MWLRNCWQVAAFAHEVIGGQLFARRICDEPIVLFRASDSRAIAFEDRCAHRNAPLSKGTLIGDVLRCGYHGLCYDTTGKCVQIPGQEHIPSKARVRSLPDRGAPPPGLDLDGRSGTRRRCARPGRALARRSGVGGERGLSPHRGQLSAAERQPARPLARDVRAHAHHRPRGGGRVAGRDQGRRAFGSHRQGNARLHAAAVLSVSRPSQGHRPHRPLAAHRVRAAGIHRDRRRRAGARATSPAPTASRDG